MCKLLKIQCPISRSIFFLLYVLNFVLFTFHVAHVIFFKCTINTLKNNTSIFIELTVSILSVKKWIHSSQYYFIYISCVIPSWLPIRLQLCFISLSLSLSLLWYFYNVSRQATGDLHVNRIVRATIYAAREKTTQVTYVEVFVIIPSLTHRVFDHWTQPFPAFSRV